jgi:uncharacterized membrane protein
MSFVFVELLLAYLSPFMIVYLRVAIGAFEQCGSVSINHHWPTNKNGRTCLYFECKYLILLATISYAFAFHFDELMSLNFVVIQYALAFTSFCSVIAYFLYFKILERTGAGNLLICTIIIPPSSILLNAILLGQVITLAKMMGLAIITIGLLVLDKIIVNRILK